MKPTSARDAAISTASAQGARPYQEDRAVPLWIDGKGWLLAVFDGHRGASTADKASAALPGLFQSHLQRDPENFAGALRETFRALHQLSRNDVSGSTASAVFISADAQRVWWAVLGDSPVALSDFQGNIRAGPDHNIRNNVSERLAAERNGGVYSGGYLEDPQIPGTGLQMTRSLGDADLDRVLNREPEIESIPLGGRAIVLVGSDGLFGPEAAPRTDQLARLLKMTRDGADAEDLVKVALRRETGDNVTAILWRTL